MIETRELRAGYHRGLDILQGVSVSAGPGRITAVLGVNGVGKSTLLKAICGFLKPAGGRVLLDGANITGIAPHRMVGHGTGYAPQQPGIFAEMTIEENVMLGGWSFRADAARLARKLRGELRPLPRAQGAPAITGPHPVRRPAPDARAGAR